MTGLMHDPLYREHLTGAGHPECPARYDAVLGALRSQPYWPQLAPIGAREATRAELLACHTEAYLGTAERDIASGAECLSTGDTAISERSWEVALRAAGGGLQAVDAAVGGGVANAFCVVRPPGHHATARQGMGFCIFNNVAMAARHAQRKHGLGRVLIADWDVHHGNGTQDIFYEDESVFFFSTHQSPLYPGTGRDGETGAGRGLGCTLNCPFPAGAGRAEILGAFETRLLPAMQRFKPELVVVSAGFDSRRDDPLGGFLLEDEDFAALTRVLLDIARTHASGRLLSVLEGGYNLRGLGLAAAAHVGALVE